MTGRWGPGPEHGFGMCEGVFTCMWTSTGPPLTAAIPALLGGSYPGDACLIQALLLLTAAAEVVVISVEVGLGVEVSCFFARRQIRGVLFLFL